MSAQTTLFFPQFQSLLIYFFRIFTFFQLFTHFGFRASRNRLCCDAGSSSHSTLNFKATLLRVSLLPVLSQHLGQEHGQGGNRRDPEDVQIPAPEVLPQHPRTRLSLYCSLYIF